MGERESPSPGQVLQTFSKSDEQSLSLGRRDMVKEAHSSSEKKMEDRAGREFPAALGAGVGRQLYLEVAGRPRRVKQEAPWLLSWCCG